MELYEVLARRRSVRRYTAEPVAANVTERITEAGRSAPISMSRHNSYRILVIDRAEETAALAEEWREQGHEGDPVYGAKVLLVVLGSEQVQESLRGADAGCIIDQMHLAATAEGLGSVYICGAIRALGAQARYLRNFDIPAGFMPLGALALGHTQEDLAPVVREKMVPLLQRNGG